MVLCATFCGQALSLLFKLPLVSSIFWDKGRLLPIEANRLCRWAVEQVSWNICEQESRWVGAVLGIEILSLLLLLISCCSTSLTSQPPNCDLSTLSLSSSTSNRVHWPAFLHPNFWNVNKSGVLLFTARQTKPSCTGWRPWEVRYMVHGGKPFLVVCFHWILLCGSIASATFLHQNMLINSTHIFASEALHPLFCFQKLKNCQFLLGIGGTLPTLKGEIGQLASQRIFTFARIYEIISHITFFCQPCI